MLLGDHAVVYGYPCLVSAVDLRVSVTVEEIDSQEILIDTPQLRKKGETFSIRLRDLQVQKTYNRRTAFVVAAVQRFYDAYGFQHGLKILTNGPTNSFGLGSSSAVTVASVFALSRMFDVILTRKQIFDLAYAAVLDVQKLGSGFDVASAVYGGTVYYQLQKEIEPVTVANWPILIGYSGEKVSTVNLVQRVRELRDRNQKIIDPMLQAIGTIVEASREYLKNKNWQAFGELMNVHQGLLAGLGVSTLSLEKPIYAARENGAYGAKLSGAGGGDCMFALVGADTKKEVETAMAVAGARIVSFSLNAEGVRIEPPVK